MRYYWLKLNKDFFKRHEVRIIEYMPNGKDYILFYLKLLVESVTHEGNLRFSDAIPYNEQMLATITNTNIDIVKSAMQIFVELKMIEILDDQTVFMAEVAEMIGSETDSAHRVREHRERKALQCNAEVTLMKQNCNIEIRDKSIELRDKNNKESKQRKFTPPSLDEISQYVKAENLNVEPTHFMDYYNSNGWLVGKNKMKDWKAACRNWSRRELKDKKPLQRKPTYDLEKAKQKAEGNTDI